MVKVVFTGFRPISVNRAYYRNRKLTDEARRFRAQVLIQLQNQVYKFTDIKSQFDPSKHCLSMSYRLYYPREIFFIKKGAISNRSQDLDNCLKLLTDCICNSRFNDEWLSKRGYREKPLYKSIKSIENLDIDDRFIQRLTAEKLPSDSYSIEVEIEIIPIPL